MKDYDYNIVVKKNPAAFPTRYSGWGVYDRYCSKCANEGTIKCESCEQLGYGVPTEFRKGEL